MNTHENAILKCLMIYINARNCCACLLEQEGLLVCKKFDHVSYMEVYVFIHSCVHDNI